MKVDVVISSDDIKNEKIKNRTVIIVDMLRATSVIVTALQNGCKAVIPVTSIEEAKKIAEKDREKYILGGERNAVKIEGFDFSNSPLEYTKDIAEEKTLIMTTSNGTKAINKAISAKNILVGALINASSVAKKAFELKNDIIIVNAGTQGQFSIDDFICSGFIADCILKNGEVEMSDIAVTAQYVYSQNTNVIDYIKKAKHYKTLINLGLEKDIEYCCKKNIANLVPEYKNGKIISM